MIDDTYNANPDSMRAAIDVLASRAAPRVLVMGDMGEVGDHGPAFHREIGAYAQGTRHRRAVRHRRRVARRLHRVSAPTRITSPISARWSRNCSRPVSVPAATVLVKGSRFMQMERVVDAVTSPQPNAAGSTPAAH